jgi:hypothetical protein
VIREGRKYRALVTPARRVIVSAIKLAWCLEIVIAVDSMTVHIPALIVTVCCKGYWKSQKQSKN